jgi:membrane protein DedA with SNARE-associated domain
MPTLSISLERRQTVPHHMTIPHWIQQAVATYGYWGVLIVVGLESMGIPLPGETALLAASIYAGTSDRISPALVILAAAAGAILGDNCGFAIGYFGGAPLLRRVAQMFHLDSRILRYAEVYFARHGNKTVFLGRFFSPLRATVALLAGINHMAWPTFLVWNMLGGITWATTFGLLGYFLGNNLTLLGRILQASAIAGIVLLGLILAGLAFFLRRFHRVIINRELSDTADHDRS